jgi:predicted secreted protein
MGWALGLVAYFTIWWTLLTAVLPWGIRSQHEVGEVIPGSEPGAPTIPNMGKRFLWNTLLSAVVWLIVDAAYIQFYLGGFDTWLKN